MGMLVSLEGIACHFGGEMTRMTGLDTDEARASLKDVSFIKPILCGAGG